MSTRLLAALMVLIIVPLLLLGWLSVGAARQQAEQAKRTVESLFEQRLQVVARDCGQTLDELQQDILSALPNPTAVDENSLRELRRRSPLVTATFWMDDDNRLIYPEIPEQVSSNRIEEYLAIDELMQVRPQTQSDLIPQSQQAVKWMPWYWQQGLQLVLWLPQENGGTVGVLLNRPAWMSRLISRLPDSLASEPLDARDRMAVAALSKSRINLIDSQSTNLYQWGTPEVSDPETEWVAMAKVSLDGPLAAWSLRYDCPQSLAVSPSTAFPIYLGIATLGLLLLSLGIYVATSFHRQMKLATQQVSFAGQVSHELRTPLTNIRLYVEMAQDELDTSSGDVGVDGLRRRLNVIEHEAQRLSRLCDNVLELVRNPHHADHEAIRETTDISAVVSEIIHQFQPGLESAGIVVEVDVEQPLNLRIDRAALEMTLVNLLSNVEKYAASGKFVRIRVCRDGNDCSLSVEDRGPGIPRAKRELIFRPFYRINTSINAPSGTGIGLSIARQAVKRARGSLRLLPGERGACFEMRLPIQ